MRKGSLGKRADIEKTFLVRVNKIFYALASGYSRGNNRVLRWASKFICAFLQGCLALLTISMILGGSSRYDFFQRLGGFVCFITIQGMCLFYVLRGKKLTTMCYEMGEKWLFYQKNVRSRAGIKILTHCEKKIQLIYYFLSISSLFCFIAHASYPIFRHHFVNGGNGQIGYPMKLTVPFEPSTNAEFCVYWIMSACLAYYCVLLSNYSTIFLGMFCTLEAAFKLNGIFYMRFNFNKPKRTGPRKARVNADHLENINRRWNVARLVLNINDHQKLYRLADDLKSLTRETLLIMYTGAIAAVAFSSFVFVMAPDQHVQTTTVIFIQSVHIFLFYYMASRVTLACETTANILYSEHMKLVKKGSGVGSKVFLFILMRSQKPVIFEAGRIRKLTLENYVSYLQNVYSFMMLLHSVNRTSSKTMQI